jgi:hypothetical protein
MNVGIRTFFRRFGSSQKGPSRSFRVTTATKDCKTFWKASVENLPLATQESIQGELESVEWISKSSIMLFAAQQITLEI